MTSRHLSSVWLRFSTIWEQRDVANALVCDVYHPSSIKRIFIDKVVLPNDEQRQAVVGFGSPWKVIITGRKILLALSCHYCVNCRRLRRRAGFVKLIKRRR